MPGMYPYNGSSTGLIINSCMDYQKAPGAWTLGARWFLKGGPILPSLRVFFVRHPFEGAFCMSNCMSMYHFSVVKVDTWKRSDSGHLDSKREIRLILLDG